MTHKIDQVSILAPGEDLFGYLNALCLLSRAVYGSWRPIKIYSHVSPLSYLDIGFNSYSFQTARNGCFSTLFITRTRL